MASKGVVGVVGLGIMGGSFAQNLVAAGWRVIGYDVAPERRRALAQLGVEIAADAVDVARKAKTIITSLPKPAALAATAAAIAKAGAAAPRHRRNVHLHASRTRPKPRRCCARPAMSCSIARSAAPARRPKTRTSWSMPRAAPPRSRSCEPLFAGFTRAVHDVGEFGNGSRMKYVANLLVAIHNVASAEAMVLGMKSGLPPQLIFDLIKTGAGNSRVFELRAPMMVKDNYDDVTMKISVWQKDMDVIGGYARKIKVPTPMFDASERDLREGAQERPRRRRHRRRLRRAGKDGRREAEQGARRSHGVKARRI